MSICELSLATNVDRSVNEGLRTPRHSAESWALGLEAVDLAICPRLDQMEGCPAAEPGIGLWKQIDDVDGPRMLFERATDVLGDSFHDRAGERIEKEIDDGARRDLEASGVTAVNPRGSRCSVRAQVKGGDSREFGNDLDDDRLAKACLDSADPLARQELSRRPHS
jgi:hypothetical protein